MADISIITPGCEDDCGRRGHRGHDGHDGATGATGPTGPTGPTGATGFAVTPLTPAGRSLDVPFMPSTTNNVQLIYTLEFSIPAAAGPVGTDIIIELRSDPGSPTTPRCSARFEFIGTAPDLIRSRQILTYICPPGNNVVLATVQNVGAGSVLIVHRTEEIFTPAP